MSSVAKHAKMEVNDELLEQLASSQEEVDAINLKSSDEILKVEQKYNKLRQPYYDKRAELIKRVSKFWVKSIINHPKISAILDEEEEDCLQFLSILEVDECEDIKSGYRIKFYFKENPYFENRVLCKEFHRYSLSNSTPIKWKEGKNLLKQVLAASYRNNKKRHSDYKSFFDWFSDDTGMVADKIAEAIRDELWPNPLEYYRMPKIEADPEDDGDEGK